MQQFFQFIILKFVYSSTCFGHFPAYHQKLNDCSGRLWVYLRIVVTVVLCSWSGRPAEDNVAAGKNVNVAVAAYVTTHARLKLYGYLRKLGRFVLYCDTDSVIYV
jgi:hypothetical protein